MRINKKTKAFYIILLILGAHNSPPETNVSSLFSWLLRKDPNAKPSFFIYFTRNPPPHPTKTTRKNKGRAKKIQTPPQVTGSRPNSRTLLFLTYSPPKSDHWTPPWDPPRSPQKVPKPTQGAPKNPQSSPRALQDPQDALGVTKPIENHKKTKKII